MFLLDDLAMGAPLALVLANVWMKSFEASLQKPELSEKISKSDQNGNGKACNRRVTFRGMQKLVSHKMPKDNK